MLRLVRSTVSTWKRWSKRRPSPLSSDCFDLQTKPNYKSIQNICKTPVFHLCHQRIGGFPWVWGKSIEDQVVLLVRLKVIPGWYHEGVVHMKRNDTCIMIKKTSASHHCWYFPGYQVDSCHLHHRSSNKTNFLTFSQRHDRSLPRAPTTVLVCSPCCCSRLRNRKQNLG